MLVISIVTGHVEETTASWFGEHLQISAYEMQ